MWGFKKLRQKKYTENEVDAIRSYYEAKIRALHSEDERWRHRFSSLPNTVWNEAWKIFNNLPKGWEVRTGRDGLELIWKDKIISTHIKWEGRIWKIPKNHLGALFVDGITIIPRSPSNSSSLEAGQNSYHPNVHYGEICIGELRGCALDIMLPKLVDCLKTCGIDDGYHNEAWHEALSICKELRDIHDVNGSTIFDIDECKESKPYYTITGGVVHGYDYLEDGVHRPSTYMLPQDDWE